MSDYRQQVKNLRAEAMHQETRFSHYILARELKEAAESIETLVEENERMRAAGAGRAYHGTVFEKLTASPASLSAVLSTIVTTGAPWDDAFHAHFCKKCDAAGCDECQHQEERNNPAWWLGMDAEAVLKGGAV